MSAPTVTIKLRDRRTNPASTQEFNLPVNRLAQTSTYFRHRLSESVSRHRDGIFRLNYPDFELFEIYAEWLRSGEICSKRGLRHIKSPHNSPSRRTPEEKARAAYTDYLGLWFLGSWVQDSTFKNGVITRIVDKMKAEDGKGYPKEFVKALKPSLVDILFVGSRDGDPIRKLIFTAIVRFAEEEDVRRFIPGEGGHDYPRDFVRELMAFLFGLHRSAHSDGRAVDTEMTADTDTATSKFTTTKNLTTESMSMPSPFASSMENHFTFASNVSWPSTSSSGRITLSNQCTVGITSNNTEDTITSVNLASSTEAFGQNTQ